MGRWERLIMRWGDGEGGNGEKEKSWQGPGKERGRREGGQEGVGWGGGDRIGTMGRILGGGNREGKMERGQREGGDGRGARGGVCSSLLESLNITAFI